MQFKSVRCSFARWLNLESLGGFTVALLAASLGWSTASHANITVTGDTPYQVINGHLYYAVNGQPTTPTPGPSGAPRLPPTIDPGSGFRLLDRTVLSASESGGDARANQIVLDIISDRSDFATATTQHLVFAILAVPAPSPDSANTTTVNSVDNIWVPISSVSTSGNLSLADCGEISDTAFCQAYDTVNSHPYFLAARVPDNDATKQFRVGFYVSDLCAYAATHSNNTTLISTASNLGGLCNADGSVADFPAGAAKQFNFYLYIFNAQTNQGTAGDTTYNQTSPNNTMGLIKGTPAPDIYTGFDLNLEADGPGTVSCTDMGNVYYPGDGQISLNTNDFSSLPILTNGSGPISIVVIGKIGTTPPVGAEPGGPYTYDQGNDFVTRVPLSGPQAVTGFHNSVGTDDNKYYLRFNVRDAAGLIADFSSDPAKSCDLNGVQTSAIQGFLAKSKCFIATAAYGDPDAGPVMLLREFRDQFLAPYAPGRSFIRWYYHWSPPAAEWLIDHPIFRGPVLVALGPVVAVAWLFLSPWLALALVGASVALIYATRTMRVRRQTA